MTLPSGWAQRPPQPLRWDIFCRVIDNFGDLGVCWRLARQLAAAGTTVRLITDDPAPLAWMAPEALGSGDSGGASVQVLAWPGPADAADVVIEAFGCDPPEAMVEAMRRRDRLVWINLEYLSAETYVERSHGLPSPRADGLRKWFFYPGFTPHTGGLMHEPDLLARQTAFDRDAWLATLGLQRLAGERVVSLFCYDNPAIRPWLASLDEAPTLLLLTQGAAQDQVSGQLNGQMSAMPGLPRRLLRSFALPWLAQRDFDHLLWASDLNAVRGEDSLVRALWAGVPFLWQAYPQGDGAHRAKVEAMIARLALPADAASAWRAWNGFAAWPGLPALLGSWSTAARATRDALLAQDDLTTRLQRFVRAHW
jgi:uncharacterized repeat protein (TIGR03837 family)